MAVAFTIIRLEAGVVIGPDDTVNGFFKYLTFQVGFHFCNRFPQFFNDIPTLKAFKTRLKGFIASQTFPHVYGFFSFVL